MAQADRNPARLTPRTFFFAVERGMRIVSSWSWPDVLCPFRSSTPITVNGILLIRMISPTGSASPKRDADPVGEISVPKEGHGARLTKQGDLRGALDVGRFDRP